MKSRNNRSKASAGAFAVLTAMAALVILTAIVMQGTVVHAVQGGGNGSKVSGRVRSSGRVQFEYAVIDGDDLRAIDTYISEKKKAAADVLIRLGTKFRQSAGEYVYDRNPDTGQENIELSGLSWAMLTQAARESQNVPAGLPVLNPEMALNIEGVEERTDFYADASEDNLSAGKAAWVDGRLLLGNGADNNRAYQQGNTDGKQGKIPDNICPIYKVQGASVEIRHAHVGSQVNSEGISGCYHNYSVTTAKTARCDTTLHYLEPIWSPNENEPGGGTWHGGFYTCSYHGGVYNSPGICGKDYVKYVTEWKHSVVCGLENMLYARLTIGMSDEEQELEANQVKDIGETERQVRLSAVLEQGEGYGRLAWNQENKLVWTDNRGNVLGVGPELTVFEAGIYRCSINVSNSDIDRRTAEAVVTVSGLMISGN